MAKWLSSNFEHFRLVYIYSSPQVFTKLTQIQNYIDSMYLHNVSNGSAITETCIKGFHNHRVFVKIVLSHYPYDPR